MLPFCSLLSSFSDVRCSQWSFTRAELPVPPGAYVALSSMAAFVPRLKFMVSSDTESFTLLVGALLPLLHCSCLPLHASCPTFITAEFHGAAPQEPRNVFAYTKMLLILLEEYCSRLAWRFSFFQIRSVNLKITTCLSSSSAFLFDKCGSRMKQNDYLPDVEHKLTANRHVIYNEKTVSACGKLHWGCCLFSISNETSFCSQIILTYPQAGCLYIQHHLKCLCCLHHSVPKNGSFSPVIWVLEGRWTYFEMEGLLNPWLVLFILCFSLIRFSKL